MRLNGVALIAALVAGCAWPAARPSGSPLAGSLEVKVAGDSVLLTLHATNVSGRALKLEYPSAQRYDFAVLDGAGATVWQWSADRQFAQVVSSEEVAAGGTVQYREAWRPGGRQGTFTAVGRLEASGQPLELRTEFRLGPD